MHSPFCGRTVSRQSFQRGYDGFVLAFDQQPLRGQAPPQKGAPPGPPVEKRGKTHFPSDPKIPFFPPSRVPATGPPCRARQSQCTMFLPASQKKKALLPAREKFPPV